MKNMAMIMHRAAKMRLPRTLIQRRRRGRISRAYEALGWRRQWAPGERQYASVPSPTMRACSRGALRQQPDTSRDDQCQRDQSPLGPTMTASAVFVKRDRTPVDGQHDPPLAARAPPLAAWGVRQGGIDPGEGTVSQSSARGVGLRMRGSPANRIAADQPATKNAHRFRIGQSRGYGAMVRRAAVGPT